MLDDPNTDVKMIQSLQDLAPDEANANLGPNRGQWTLRESLIRFGDRAGRVVFPACTPDRREQDAGGRGGPG